MLTNHTRKTPNHQATINEWDKLEEREREKFETVGNKRKKTKTGI
jgi:hypothetical protein